MTPSHADDLGGQENSLTDQVNLQHTAVEMKKNQVDMSKEQTNEYRAQLAARQRDYADSKHDLQHG